MKATNKHKKPQPPHAPTRLEKLAPDAAADASSTTRAAENYTFRHVPAASDTSLVDPIYLPIGPADGFFDALALFAPLLKTWDLYCDPESETPFYLAPSTDRALYSGDARMSVGLAGLLDRRNVVAMRSLKAEWTERDPAAMLRLERASAECIANALADGLGDRIAHDRYASESMPLARVEALLGDLCSATNLDIFVPAVAGVDASTGADAATIPVMVRVTPNHP